MIFLDENSVKFREIFLWEAFNFLNLTNGVAGKARLSCRKHVRVIHFSAEAFGRTLLLR